MAVASSLKQLDPGLRIVYIGQAGDKLADIPAADPNVDEVYTVRAGKFRRYHGEGWRQLLDLPTQFKNIRDAVYVLIGLVQSYRLMRRLKPSVVFSRGGFVSVPVALGGHLAGVPYITHDSDSVPSLANRLIARWARLHAVALPEDSYPYPRNKTKMVGIPLLADYQPVTAATQAAYKHQVGVAKDGRLLLVTGGGNGAQELNEAVVANAPFLLKRYPDLHIIHVAGRDHEAAIGQAYDTALTAEERQRVLVHGFVTEFYRYSGAADIIIGRAGATNLAEFAAQGKVCVIVPAGQLVGGHQLKNARILAREQAIVLMTSEQIEQERRLTHVISELLDDATKRRELADHIARFARPNAAEELAALILEIAGGPQV
ncbi:MAG TPA: glycosyltransferase [Candidatus Saccharimonadales bacterium]|nr:glycosyltransferase [Candidatus Saccharimonadales bacterium]